MYGGKVHPKTFNRFTKHDTYCARLRTYGDACRQLGAGTVNSVYVEQCLSDLKQAVLELINAAREEGESRANG